MLFYVANPSASALKRGNALHYQADDRLDMLKELFPWATQQDRIKAHRKADQIRAEASDFNLNRVKTGLDDGLTVAEIAKKFGLPMEAVEHLRQLVDWRFGQQNRYTLTEAGLRLAEESTARDAA